VRCKPATARPGPASPPRPGVAGINMIIFEFITVRDVQKWNVDKTPPPRARLAGGMSIGCWVLVVVFGRLIGFTLQRSDAAA
jgi:hypothetical protein